MLIMQDTYGYTLQRPSCCLKNKSILAAQINPYRAQLMLLAYPPCCHIYDVKCPPAELLVRLNDQIDSSPPIQTKTACQLSLQRLTGHLS